MKTYVRRGEFRTWAARYIQSCRRDLRRDPGNEFSRGRIAGVQAMLNLMGEISLETALRLPKWMYCKVVK